MSKKLNEMKNQSKKKSVINEEAVVMYTESPDELAMFATDSIINNNKKRFYRLLGSLSSEQVDELLDIPVFGKTYMVSMYDTSSFKSLRKSCLENKLVSGSRNGSISCSMVNVLLSLVLKYGFDNNIIEYDNE